MLSITLGLAPGCGLVTDVMSLVKPGKPLSGQSNFQPEATQKCCEGGKVAVWPLDLLETNGGSSQPPASASVTFSLEMM